jgi:serine protease Do
MKRYQIIATILALATLLLSACSGTALPASSTTGILTAPQEIAQVTSETSSANLQSNTGFSSLSDYEQTMENVYTQVNPSVVNIQVVSQTSTSNQTQQLPGAPFGFGNPGSGSVQEALGSGFVWDTQGHIVTNNHVVSGATKISVTFSDGTTLDAKLVGADPDSDLAVIQVDSSAASLQPVELADVSQVKVGQLAIAIGNPYGLSGTMTTGIISALSRSLPVGLDNSTVQSGPTYTIPDIIQTDAAINPGNSGGVLVNTQGQLIGVTAAIESSVQANSGIGFVIPSTIVQKVIPVLIQSGSYDHPRLGISGTSMTPDLAQAMNLDSQQNGALVIDVTANSPAAKSGIQGSNQAVTIQGQQTTAGGDVIIAIDGQPVNSFDDLASYLFTNTEIGQTVTLTVLRQGQEKQIDVTLSSLPSQ